MPSADRFQRTIHHLQVGVLVQGPNAEILLSNPMALELLGLTEDQLLGRSSFDPSWNVIHEDGSPFPGESHPVPVAIRERRPVRNVVMGVSRVRQGQAERGWLLVNAEPELDDEGAVVQVLCSFTDITERKKLELAFVEAQKLEVVGRLAGGVAHDFNNLLCVMIGLSDSVLRRLDPTTGLHADVQRIMLAAERGAGLTRQLLTFAGRNPLAQPRRLSVGASLRGIQSLLAPIMGDAITLDLAIDPPDDTTLMVNMDPTGLEQVLLNLAVNARDAMPRGGSLGLRARSVVVHAGEREELPPGQYVQLSVVDTGTGIPAAVLPQIFEPFFTTKELGRGTGLGLPMVREVVRRAGGVVWVDSAVGEGTSVHVLLPRIAAAPEEPAKAPAAQARGRGRESILVVEDDAALRDVIARHLRELGYQVSTAEDGQAALDRAARSPVQLVLSDVYMPNADAVRMMKVLEAITPGVKVLLMSGYSAASLRELGIDPDHVRVLNKPFTPTELAESVRAVFDDPV